MSILQPKNEKVISSWNPNSWINELDDFCSDSQQSWETFKFKDNYITLIFSYNTKINTTLEKISANHKEYIWQLYKVLYKHESFRI